MQAILPVLTSDIDLFADDVLHDPYPALDNEIRGRASLPVTVRTEGR